MVTTRTGFIVQRLWLARALAWALLFGGWLALGALGREHLPHVAGGLAPLALWLLVIGVALGHAGRRAWPVAQLRAALIVGGLATLVVPLVLASRGIALLSIAFAWALLVVAASCSVRALRGLQVQRPPAPVAPAMAGAVLAWLLFGDLAALRGPLQLGPALAAIGLLLVALLPPGASARPGCRSGLFDCSMPMLLLRRWRHASGWPLAAAALGMLPMMASLSQMAEACGTLRWPASAVTALHLTVMVLPAACVSLRHTPRVGSKLIAALLVAGGAAALLAPGLVGWMAASLLHGIAWSLAWVAMLNAPRSRTDSSNAVIAPLRVPSSMWPAAANAGVVLLLGLAIDRVGPASWVAVHIALAGCGLFGLLAISTGLKPIDAPPARSAAPVHRP